MAFNFKSEEDVKLYLQNIYIEYKFGCESEKKGDACHLLGDYMEGIKQNYTESAKLYKSNCDERNWARSCAKFAGYKSIGKGCDADMNDAYKYMKKSCDLGDPRGCVKGGAMALSRKYQFEKDRATELKVGLEMLTKSCAELNELSGCFKLSTIHLGVMKDEIEPNLSEGYKLSLKCCESGNPYACSNVSQMFARGQGVEQNADLAATFKKRAEDLYRDIKEVQRQLKFGEGIDT